MTIKIKEYFQLVVRYIKSINVYLLIIIKSINNKKATEALLLSSFKKVHILCPGPSAKKILNEEINKDECIIFINHAIKMLPNIKSNHTSFFYFTSDGTRFKENLNDSADELTKATSIIFAEHLFHFNSRLVNKCDIFFVPQVKFNKKFGIVGKNEGPHSFQKIKKNPIISGFGSMINSLQLAVLFKPKKIKLWGCDMLDINNERYFDKSVPIRSTDGFELTKKHFSIIKQKILDMGIPIYLK
jgi:hypothetical protein